MPWYRAYGQKELMNLIIMIVTRVWSALLFLDAAEPQLEYREDAAFASDSAAE